MKPSDPKPAAEKPAQPAKRKLPEELELAGVAACLGALALCIYLLFSHQGPVEWIGRLGLGHQVSFVITLVALVFMIRGAQYAAYWTLPRYRAHRRGEAPPESHANAAIESRALRNLEESAEEKEPPEEPAPAAAQAKPPRRGSALKWRIVRAIGLITFFGAVIVPSITAFLKVPPFRWMSQMQTRFLGGYSAFASWLLCAALWGGLGLLLLWLLDPLGILAGGPKPGAKPRREPPPRRAAIARRFDTTTFLFLFAAAVIILVAVCTGLYALVLGNLTPVTVAGLQDGTATTARWVEVEGVVLHDRWVGAGEHQVVVPLVTPNWQPSDPVKVFLRLTQKEFDHTTWPPGGAGRFKGLVSMFDVGGEARSEFSRHQHITAAPHSYCIDLDESPAYWGDTSRMMWGISGALAGIGGFFWLLGRILPSPKPESKHH